MSRLLERVNFPKLIVILASTFGIALGACGLTALVSGSMGGNQNLVLTLGFAELAVMILSAVGLVLTVILWMIVSIIRGRHIHGSGPQSLSDPTSEDKERHD